MTYGFLMQVYADVVRRPVSVATSDQAPAFGSAIDAALHSELVRYGLGEPLPIPPSNQDRLYERYQNAYGQR